MDWKKIIISVTLQLLGLILILAQFQYAFFSWANVWSARIYIILCIGLISLGLSWNGGKDLNGKIKIGIVSFVLMVGAFLAIGGFGQLNDAMNGTTFTEGSGIWLAFDVTGASYTNAATDIALIINTILGTLPSIILLVIVIKIWMEEGGEGTWSVVTEGVIIIAFLVVFGFFGNLIGFDLFGRGSAS